MVTGQGCGGSNSVRKILKKWHLNPSALSPHKSTPTSGQRAENEYPRRLLPSCWLDSRNSLNLSEPVKLGPYSFSQTSFKN